MGMIDTWKILRRKHHLVNAGVNEMIILKWILCKLCVKGVIVHNWLRVGFSGEIL
jgi:hypothetical protein